MGPLKYGCYRQVVAIKRHCAVQTCSNNHLYKTITPLRRPMLNLPRQILIQSLLCKMTTCLMQPASTLFVSQMKKNLPKTTTTKLKPAKKWETNIRQQCKKKNVSLIIVTLSLLYNVKFYVY